MLQIIIVFFPSLYHRNQEGGHDQGQEVGHHPEHPWGL